jgi:hypothetical protein
MAESARLFISRLAFKLATAARKQARARVRSQRIAESMELRVLDFGKVAVHVPYYWAVYYHDGRGPIRAKKGHKLVFFKNPDDDPRINGPARNYPKRAADIRRLSARQFYRFLREGKIYAVDSVKRARGDPFFTRGLKSFPNKARRIGRRDFSTWMKASLGKDLRKKERLLVIL